MLASPHVVTAVAQLRKTPLILARLKDAADMATIGKNNARF
jgi:hypothetical protein